MYNLLIFVVIVLFVIAAARVIRIFELSAELKGGRNDDKITEGENRNMAYLWVLFLVAFFGFCLWQVMKYKDKLLPVSASEHGVVIDKLFDVTLILITIVFILTHIVMVYQAYKNYGRKNRKATFFAHSTKLELIWTIIPAIVLTGLIVYGLTVWNRVIYPSAENPVLIELYAKQYDWTARYAGEDGKLGDYDFRLIGQGNDLGLVEDEYVNDDKLVKAEFHLPVNRAVLFKFRSRDVIHSAYMPHFRAQMNCVPGMETQFEFIPTITTAEMRKITGNEKFNYVLLCNKICGASHFNMQMDIVVESEEDYNKWLLEQKTFLETQAATAQSSSKDSEKIANLIK
jgi:cytochrome c oxidase subunit 2